MEDAPKNSSCSSDIKVQDNASPPEATTTKACDDLNTDMPNFPPPKPCFTKKSSRGNEDEMDMHFLDELK